MQALDEMGIGWYPEYISGYSSHPNFSIFHFANPDEELRMTTWMEDWLIVRVLLKKKRERQARQYLAKRLSDRFIERPLIPTVTFDLDKMANTNCRLNFRFDKRGMLMLGNLIGIDAVVITKSRHRCHQVEALAIVLYRLSFPRRYHDMALMFGKSNSYLCEVFNYTLDMIACKSDKIMFFHKSLLQARMDVYCQSVHGAGAPVDCVYGFIDGSKFRTCRIKATDGNYQLNLQKEIYSGHKRMHCLNYQAVTAPDGLCIHFFGPVVGSRHDSTLLRLSGLYNYLEGTITKKLLCLL